MKRLKEQLKCTTVILCLCVVAVIGKNTKLAAQDGCPPATCPNGSHSVCHKECDPNVSPICSPRCVCRCEPDGSSLMTTQQKQGVYRTAQTIPLPYLPLCSNRVWDRAGVFIGRNAIRASLGIFGESNGFSHSAVV